MPRTKGGKLARFFLDGDAAGAISFIREQPSQEWIYLYQDLFTEAMYEIGALWERNEISVADEHLATGVCDYVMSRLFQLPENKEADKRAMFLCLEGEQHYLGLKMVNHLFEERGWETKYFGSSLPLEYAYATANKWQPDVIGLSVSIVYHLPQLKKYVEQLAVLPHRPVILVGGRLAGQYDLVQYTSGKCTVLNNLIQMEYWLKTFSDERISSSR
ncbi:MAG: cobalamin-dependent protein [Bacillota bacterium]|nr:cobalamin-dependent protein [Bacillota bacterium]MDP4169680.1 cobalamin-dependent protein [Bacillota bacterium]